MSSRLSLTSLGYVTVYFMEISSNNNLTEAGFISKSVVCFLIMSIDLPADQTYFRNSGSARLSTFTIIIFYAGHGGHHGMSSMTACFGRFLISI